MTALQTLIDKLYEDDRIPSIEQAAYVLATVKHETAGTFLPIKEFGEGKGKKYGLQDPTTGQTYFGRGYVQLTWAFNYERFTGLLGHDLVNNPDLALLPDVAYEIMIEGMIKGIFTGKKLSDYMNEDKTD
mgnify:FL=1